MDIIHYPNILQYPDFVYIIIGLEQKFVAIF